jgi:hypothetical protein
MQHAKRDTLLTTREKAHLSSHSISAHRASHLIIGLLPNILYGHGFAVRPSGVYRQLGATRFSRLQRTRMLAQLVIINGKL